MNDRNVRYTPCTCIYQAEERERRCEECGGEKAETSTQLSSLPRWEVVSGTTISVEDPNSSHRIRIRLSE